MEIHTTLSRKWLICAIKRKGTSKLTATGGSQRDHEGRKLKQCFLVIEGGRARALSRPSPARLLSDSSCRCLRVGSQDSGPASAFTAWPESFTLLDCCHHQSVRALAW